MMESNNNLHHRRSIRLADYDYSAEGGYFITIVTQGRVRLFGKPSRKHRSPQKDWGQVGRKNRDEPTLRQKVKNILQDTKIISAGNRRLSQGIIFLSCFWRAVL